MIDDFTYDFTHYLKQNKDFYLAKSKDIILRFYLYTHQFCNKIEDFKTCYFPCVFEDFLEEDEEVYVNIIKHKLYFKIKNYKSKDIKEKIEFILNTLGFKIETIIDENNLEITYKKYDNTNNREIIETIYQGNN